MDPHRRGGPTQDDRHGRQDHPRRPHRDPRNIAAPHLVAAFDHHTGTVLGQLAIAAKSNEIPAVRTLLAGFDLRGVVVTVDAISRLP